MLQEGSQRYATPRDSVSYGLSHDRETWSAGCKILNGKKEIKINQYQLYIEVLALCFLF